MSKILFLVILVILCQAASAQTDSTVQHMPFREGKLIYTDTLYIAGKTQHQLDSTAKAWFASYYKYQHPLATLSSQDSVASIWAQNAVEFKMAPATGVIIKYNFLLVSTLRITCYNNKYIFNFSDIYFVPKSSFARSIIIYQSRPEHLLELYQDKNKHFQEYIGFNKKKAAKYLLKTHQVFSDAILSLTKTMAGAVK